MGRLLQTGVTAALWVIIVSAASGASVMMVLRSVMLVATFGMACDSCNGIDDVLTMLGVYPVVVIYLIGAMVLVVWHRDRWPYKLAAPAMLAVAIGLAPAVMRGHWFWWLGL